MIEVQTEVKIRCDSPGCHNWQLGKLVLQATGGFGVLPQTTTWQVVAAPNAVLVIRCPEHRMVIEQGPGDHPLDRAIRGEYRGGPEEPK